MLPGHFTTAILAKQRVPAGHIAFYLVASQSLDLLWLVFHYLGLEPTLPDNAMAVTLTTLDVDMTYSHDLLPLPVWMLITVLAGRWLFGAWRPGWVGAALVLVHALTDYIGGYEHFVFGPNSQVVGTGLYETAPYLAVSLELVFILVTMAWVVRTDRQRGVRRSRRTWLAWAAVFGGGMAFMFGSATRSFADILGTTPPDALAGTTVPVMAVTYVSMLLGLIWAEKQPLVPDDGE